MTETTKFMLEEGAAVLTIMRVGVVAALTLFLFSPAVRTQGGQGGPPSDRPAQGELNRADPCTHDRDPAGNANGIGKHCAVGGSGGVGRGDFNNDGIGDLAVGVPDETRISRTFDPDRFRFFTTDHPGAGAVNIIYGGAGGLTPTGSQILDQGPLGVSDNAHFGRALAAGRFRGPDFASDLAVGAPGVRRNGALVGAIYIFFSNAQGRLNISPNQTFFANDFSPGDSLLGANPLAFPETMSMVWGDFNGDNVGDLAVEVINSGVQQNSRNAVLVLYGTAGSGLSRTNFSLLVVDEGLHPGNANPPTGCETQRFCASARGGDLGLAASDLNGDLMDELLIGAPNCREIDDNFDNVPGSPRGCVAIARGRATGFNRFFGWDVLRPEDTGPDDNAGFGRAIAVGNFNGTGAKDVAVGAPDTRFQLPDNAGAVRVFSDVQPFFSQDVIFADSVLLSQNDVLNQAAEANDRFGSAIATNDFHGDGFADLAVGAPGESTGTNAGHGAVTLFNGSAGGLVTANLTLSGATIPVLGFGGSALGSSLTAWNFGLTPEADLMVGSPFFTIIRFTPPSTISAVIPGAGSVVGLYGLPQAGLTPTNMQLWTQNPGFAVCTPTFITCLSTAGTARTGNHFGAAVY